MWNNSLRIIARIAYKITRILQKLNLIKVLSSNKNPFENHQSSLMQENLSTFPLRIGKPRSMRCIELDND
jgi:hypothetical protein